MSGRVGNRLADLRVRNVARLASAPGCCMISATPNMPIATTTKPMPSASSGMPKVKRSDAGVDVGADQAEQQAEHHHGDRLEQRAARQHDRGDQRRAPSARSIRPGRTCSATPASSGAASGDDQRGDACRRRTSRSRRSRAPDPARPWRAIWWPSSTVTDRGGLAGQVDQDRGGRAAVLRAVVDAGEHDQRSRRRQA